MIATLLGLALQLLVAAQQPNVSQTLKDQAISVALIAIQYAQDNATTTQALTPSATPTPATITVTPTQQPPAAPVYGNINTPTVIQVAVPIMPKPTCTLTAINDFPNGAVVSWTTTNATGGELLRKDGQKYVSFTPPEPLSPIATGTIKNLNPHDDSWKIVVQGDGGSMECVADIQQ